MSRGYIRQRNKGSWSITISAGRDPATGKRKQYSYTVRGSKKDAEKFRTQKLHEIDRNTFIAPSKMTVRQFLEDWLDDYVQGHTKLTTHDNYKCIIERHIVPALGGLSLDQLEPIHIQKLYSGKRRGGRADGKDGGLSVRTIRCIHGILREALGYAVDLKLLQFNPALNTKPPRQERKKLEVWNASDVSRFLDKAADNRFCALFVVALYTGLRRGELLALKWEDVDLENRIISVNKTLVKTSEGLKVQTPKTETSVRKVTLPKTVVDTLRSHRRRQAGEKLAAGSSYQDSGLVFCSYIGTPLNPENLVKRFFYPVVEKAGLPKITFHGLRHTHATLLLENKQSANAVADRLGHSNPGFTLRTYGHTTRETHHQLAEELENIIRQCKAGEEKKEPASAPLV